MENHVKSETACPYHAVSDQTFCNASFCGFLCTRPEGHDGLHVACGRSPEAHEHPLVMWPEGAPAPTVHRTWSQDSGGCMFCDRNLTPGGKLQEHRVSVVRLPTSTNTGTEIRYCDDCRLVFQTMLAHVYVLSEGLKAQEDLRKGGVQS